MARPTVEVAAATLLGSGPKPVQSQEEVRKYGCRKWYHTFRIAYADGRMLWWNNLRDLGSGGDYSWSEASRPKASIS